MQVQSLLRKLRSHMPQGKWACIPQIEKPPCSIKKSTYHKKEPVQPKLKKKKKNRQSIKTAKSLKKKN